VVEVIGVGGGPWWLVVAFSWWWGVGVGI